jgi:hypothetical protein
MGIVGADKKPASDAEGSSGVARGLQGPAQANRGRHGEAPLPALGGQGDAAPAHPRPVPAPAGVPGGVPRDGLRRTRGDEGARERVGDREGPEVLGGPGGVQAGEVRGVRRGLQGRRLRVHPFRRRPADVRRRRARAGQHGGCARGPALPLRLGASGGRGGRGARRGGGPWYHREEEVQAGAPRYAADPMRVLTFLSVVAARVSLNLAALAG